MKFIEKNDISSKLISNLTESCNINKKVKKPKINRKLKEAEDKFDLNDYKVTASKDYKDSQGNKYAIGTLKDGRTFFLNDEGYSTITTLTTEELKDFVDSGENTIDSWNSISAEEHSYEDINDGIGQFIAHQVWPDVFEIQSSDDEEFTEFNGIEFEKNIPHKMRFKEYDVLNLSDEDSRNRALYWVTQEVFSLKDLETFKKALEPYFTDNCFDVAYVTVRDFSTYDFKTDRNGDVFAEIYKDGNIDYTGYKNRIIDCGWEEDLEESEINEDTTDEGEEYDDFIYQLVGGKLAGEYTLEELKQLPIFTDEDSGDNPGRRKELKNQPILKDYYGPMWNGVKNKKGIIRYETPEVYDMLSENRKVLEETGEWDDEDDEMQEWLEDMRIQAEELASQIKGEVKSVHGFDKYQGPFAIVNSPKHGDIELWYDQEDDTGRSFIAKVAHVGWISGGINDLANQLNQDEIPEDMIIDESCKNLKEVAKTSVNDYTRRSIQKILGDETDNYVLKVVNRTKNTETKWLDITYDDIMKMLGSTVNEAEVSGLNLIKNQGNVYMFEAKGQDFTHIVGENYDAKEHILEKAETYNSKDEADKDYMKRCGIEV